MPPSDSGIAAFSAAFAEALGTLGDVTEVGLALDAAATQRLGEIARTLTRVRRAWRAQRPDLVVTHLSGRALAEGWSCVVQQRAGRSARHWVVLHDPPSLVGAALLVAPLDRRGGRRAGLLVSRWIGEPLMRDLARRADAVITLSPLGAQLWAEHHPGVEAVTVPLPCTVPDDAGYDVERRHVVYVPAHADARSVEPVLAAMAQGPPEATLLVGQLAASDESHVVREARRLGLERRMRLLGRLDDRGYRDSFGTAGIVVRHRGQGGGNPGAVSGPITLAMAAGCAVVTTDARGSAPCLSGGAGIDLSERAEELVPTLVGLLVDPERARAIGVAARAHVREHHAPDVVGRDLRELWRLGRRR